jgi:hypothetical protein
MFDCYVETDQMSPALKTVCILLGADVEEVSIEWTRVRCVREDARDEIEALHRSRA